MPSEADHAFWTDIAPAAPLDPQAGPHPFGRLMKPDWPLVWILVVVISAVTAIIIIVT